MNFYKKKGAGNSGQSEAYAVSFQKMGNKKEEYDFYKSIGICVRCHKNPAEPNRVMCLECADKERETDRKKRRKNSEKIRVNDISRYHRLKEQGICTYCKRKPAISGKTKCEKCLAKIRAKQNAARNDLMRSERVSYRICYICGKNEIIPGHGVCESCYQTRLQAIGKCMKPAGWF